VGSEGDCDCLDHIEEVVSFGECDIEGDNKYEDEDEDEE
jgi:hypothetical protein